MAPDTVAFLDSGIGGLPYLDHARRSLPGYRYLYVADRENFPYGGKQPSQIIDAVTSVAARVIQREDPRLIVIACNTASVVALSALRERFPVPFVGVVPAVKPAALRSRCRRVGVLATQATVEGEYLAGLIREHAADCSVVSLPASTLVQFVERDGAHASAEERRSRVRTEVARFQETGIDTLVLGCTHFLLLEEEFSALLREEGIALVDSRDGVSKQVARLLNGGAARREVGARAWPTDDPERRPDTFFVTGTAPLEERYAAYAERFGLSLGGAL